jgi:hypothetical protein
MTEEYIIDAINKYADWYTTYDWKIYCHMTTTVDEKGRTVSDEIILKYWKRLVRKINIALWGKHFFRKGSVSWVVGIEKNGSKHIHGLIGGLGSERICRMCLIRVWERIGKRTGICRVYSFDQEKAKMGIFYLCKHQIKKGNIRDWFGIVKIKPIKDKKIIHITEKGKKFCKMPLKKFGQDIGSIPAPSSCSPSIRGTA